MFQLPFSSRLGALAVAIGAMLIHGCAGIHPPGADGLSSGQTNDSRIATGQSKATMTDDEIRQSLLIDPTSFIDRTVVSPSSGFLTPSAYGADNRDAYIGVAGRTAGNNSDLDGSASFGIGFGDATENIGVEINAAIISLLDDFAEDGSIGLKLHRYFPDAGKVAVALGWSNPIAWGAAEDSADTFYGVVTRRFELNGERPMPLTASLGIGTGSFRSQSAIDDNENTPNLFGSVSARIKPHMSLISSWTGRSLGVAASLAPSSLPLVITVGLSDITDRTSEGTRFQGTLGYSFSF
jgi:hypothetical protein